ncbi:glycoside hydrolase [Lachnospiraceae bacterium ZAX-1]
MGQRRIGGENQNMRRLDISSKKEVKKLARSIAQAIVLLVLLYFIIKALFTFITYQPATQADATKDDFGFIAISYFGVDREGNSYLISTEQLNQQLEALYQQGYKTITQQDIQNYYTQGTLLPPKALFLMFEDGRRDTSIFAQKIMEDYNFKATMMSYGEKFEDTQSKFLTGEDLKELVKTTFWELGTNGYRLSYINVFDRYDHYLGELDNIEYARVSQYLGRNYNHYLMDFIRDEDDIPKESRNWMEARIQEDYRLMEEVYTKGVGYLPQAYILMHSNTGAFGNNDKVSAVNKDCIEEKFTMNFNREGYSHNNLESSIYDLTRMQPQAYWYTNHLLMRIKDDTGTDVIFREGDSKKKENWELLHGASEFTKNKIIVTSESEGSGLVALKENENLSDFYFSTTLTGNKLGEQTAYVRAVKDLSTYIAIKIKDNVLSICEKAGGEEKELYSVNLDVIDKIEQVSLEEDEKAALIGEYETFLTYADSDLDKLKYKAALDEIQGESVATVSEGAAEYIEEIGINELGNRKLEFSLIGNKLNVLIDGKEAAKDLDVAVTKAGSILLSAAWSGEGWSQRNVTDDVYDAIFEDLYVSEDEAGKQLLYNQRLEGFDQFKNQVTKVWDSITNWFIKYL